LEYNKDMKFIQKNLNKIIIFIYIFIVPVISFSEGQNPPGGSGGKIIDPLGANSTIPGLINTVLQGFLKIGIPIIALAIIYSGFLFVFARGNSEKLTKAKDALLYTIIGAAILLGSWAIAKMIQVTITGLAG